MKSEFSKSWNSSKQPRKQRKFVANAPNHIKRKFMGVGLDKGLRAKYGIRSIEIRRGDEVKIMRGKFAKKQGKVGSVDIKNTRIQIDGMQRTKKGGEKVETWFHPSNVKIIILDDSDNKRMKRSVRSADLKLRSSGTKIVNEEIVAPKGIPPAQTASANTDKVGKIKTKSKEMDNAHKEN